MQSETRSQASAEASAETSAETPAGSYARVWARLSGAELLEQIAAGRLPAPDHARYVGFSISTVTPGLITAVWRPTPAVQNLSGVVHGGYLAMVLDDGAALACASLGERFRPMLTLSLHLDFLRTARAGQPYTVTGTVIHPGRQRMVADAEITDPDGRPLARATGSFTPNLAFDPTAATP